MTDFPKLPKIKINDLKENYAFRWDWKGFPPVEEIIRTSSEMLFVLPRIYTYTFENGDDCGVLLSAHGDLGDEKALEIWKELINE